MLKRRTSVIVLAPAKSICSQSGKAPGVPSCQPPFAPQLTPVRSPLIAPAAPNPLSAEEAVAVAPALAAATLTPGRDRRRGSPASMASTSAMRLRMSDAPVTRRECATW